MRNVSLSSKIYIAFALAVLVPLIMLVIFGFVNIQSNTLSSLEAFVAESGLRRQEAIENDIRTALNLLNEFTDGNQTLIETALELRSSGQITNEQGQVEGRIRDIVRGTLLTSNYFYEVSLLNPAFSPFATTSTGQVPSIGFERQARTDIGNVIANMDIANGDRQAFAITNRDGVAYIEVVNVITNTDENGNITPLGYVLASLNLDVIFIENLRQQIDAGNVNPYAYLILQETNQVLAPPEILENNLVDDTSSGADRARDGRIVAGIYTVGAEDNQRDVLGYSSRIEIDNEEFSMVTEADLNTLRQSLFSQTATRIFPILLGILGVSILISILLDRNIVHPLRRLRNAVVGVLNANFEEPVPDVQREDEIGALATSFVDMRDFVREQGDEMNRRLAERTRDVQVTQDIGRAITAERDAERLMSRVVNMIVQNFPDIYHAQIFLLDADRQFAVLRASTGQAGRELLSRGHKLGVGSVSVIGQVTEQGQLIIARDTAESTVHRQNEFLGQTLAELAIPLRLGNEVIGALDVQSKERDVFDNDLVTALQTLADQITIAIENARLYAESARLLANIERERSASTKRNWQDYIYQQRQASLAIKSGVETGYDFEKLRTAVLRSGQAVVGDATSRNTIPFAVPVSLRGQVLGVVEYEVPKAEFNYDKVLLAEELVSRLAISLENARLFQSSQEATDRERIVNEISTKLTGQTDIEEILQTAIKEVGQALRTPQIAIRLQMPHGANGNHQPDEQTL